MKKNTSDQNKSQYSFANTFKSKVSMYFTSFHIYIPLNPSNMDNYGITIDLF